MYEFVAIVLLIFIAWANREALAANHATDSQEKLVDRARKKWSLWGVGLDKAMLGKAGNSVSSFSSVPDKKVRTYRAAVVEFAAVTVSENWQAMKVKEATALKLVNLGRLESYATQAKHSGAQIIVFPENGITGHYSFNRTTVSPFLEEVPSNSDPCDEPSSQAMAPAITRASCMAKELAIVLVINLKTRAICWGQVGCPVDGMRIHNTAIAFSEAGSILAVYNKRNLWLSERNYANPGDLSMKRGATFTTSFGVKFGMFICFDMIWFNDGGPSDAMDIVFPTDWDNRFGLGARRAMQMWSQIHRKNVLAANYGGLGKQASGSGIWHKGKALESYFNPTRRPESRLLIADVPVINRHLHRRYSSEWKVRKATEKNESRAGGSNRRILNRFSVGMTPETFRHQLSSVEMQRSASHGSITGFVIHDNGTVLRPEIGFESPRSQRSELEGTEAQGSHHIDSV